MAGAPQEVKPLPEAAVGPTQGTSFGKYQLFASLGRGGMADVFLSVARGPMGFNKLVVIKRLRQALAEEPSFRTMFLDEARLAARLNHPNIVHTYEVGEHNGIYFIAMEYLEGQSLNKVMKDSVRAGGTLPEVIAARIVADALSGLNFAHELKDYDGSPLGIIHRDVSPHNIFVTYDGHTKLVDFGIAKAALSSTETEVGVLKGKVAYMSPEQAMGGAIDCRADIFPMGIVLWELLTGKRLMTGESAAQTLHRLVNVPIPRVRDVVPTVDPILDEITARALEKDPMARYQSAAEMRDALESYLARLPGSRQDEVGRRMVEIFGHVREEVQRQIQKHMAAINAAGNTQELQALTAESLKRMERSGANISGQLLHLGVGSGSGSGIISNYPPNSDAGGASGVHAAQAGQRRANAVLVVALLLFLVTAAGAGVMYWKSRTTAGGPLSPLPSATLAIDPQRTASATASVVPSLPSATIELTQTPTQTASVVPPGPTGKTGPKGTIPPKTTPAGKTTAAATTATTAPPAEEPGFLTLQTYPFSRVTLGGRVLGTTPLVKVSLPPGAHTLVAENADQGLKQSISVTIESGKTTTKNLELRK